MTVYKNETGAKRKKEKTVYKEYIAHGNHKSKFGACIPDTELLFYV